jgi:hypothetical protein
MGKQISEYTLYRWRYPIGYTIIGIIVVGMILVAGLFIPGGLSQGEINSVVASNSLSFSLTSFDPTAIVNLPYHILQHFSLDLFGVTMFSVKLPSLILGILSVLGIILLLRMWFKPNIALLTTILVITTGQFLFMAQNGTPSIVYIFWTVWIFVAALKISRRGKWSFLWKMLLFALAAFSLYTPLSIYVLFALVSAAILHPHLRYIIRHLSKLKISVGSLGALIIIAPLVYVVVLHPDIGLKLLGVPTQWPNLAANTMKLLHQYFDFIKPGSDMLMWPIYGLGSMTLIFLGIYRLFTTKYTARSYIISTLAILLAPVLIINPNFNGVTFVPIILLMAMGVNTLVSQWYRLFPRNPYARFAGLIPLIVLMGGLVLSGMSRYTYGYLYDPQTANSFTKDLRIANRLFNANVSGKSAQFIVSKNEVAFYSVIAHHHEGVTVDTQLPLTADNRTLIITHAAHATFPVQSPYRIITDDRSHDSDRFYIYKTDQK